MAVRVVLAKCEFLARDSICCRVLYAIARPSAGLSVTRVDQSKTLEVRIMQLSPPPHDSSFLVVNLTSHHEIPKGRQGARAPNKRGVGKIRNCQQISRRISETVQDRTKVTIND